MAELTKLVRSERIDACVQALEQVEAVQSMGLADAMPKAKAKWLNSVDTALASDQVSFATLPVNELLDADGLLSRLREKGYDIQAPE